MNVMRTYVPHQEILCYADHGRIIVTSQDTKVRNEQFYQALVNFI